MNKIYLLSFLFWSITLSAQVVPKSKIDVGNYLMTEFDNITLEMSLKPFKKNDKAYIESVCYTVYEQWAHLLKHADTISVMLWAADGSEILDYSGDLKQRLEWAMYIGNPNTEYEVNSEPDKHLSLHQRAFTYMESPPEYTYADLKFIVKTLKRIGHKITGKPIRVGSTFDPGPEFAKSPFKYKKHPEICMANTMGTKTFVCCYATLNQDDGKYAAYPKGIPQGTPLGTFFGKQSQAFLTDLGFDYLWLSNGFGFGLETWSANGAIFDGKDFQRQKMNETRNLILDFWKLFRAECPDFRIETRGTNLSVGIDLAGDGVDLRSIYNGGFNILPPPNSPWAALDGDFGLELTGYMSRMAELPDNRYLFRYYTHDPWWVNSPWLDRYGREAHDIYLPMAVSRIDKKGNISQPTHLNFLSIDDSYGNMPDQVPDEVIPHILQGRRNAPDQAGLTVWVYPFDEYHDWAYTQPERLEEIYYGDWFIRQAINHGFPMNTVLSSGNFTSLMQQEYQGLNGSVLVTVVPDDGSEMEKHLMNFVRKGGKVIVYGPVGHAGKEFLDFINIRLADPLSGNFVITPDQVINFDWVESPLPHKLQHDSKWSAGGLETIIADKNEQSTKVLVKAHQNEKVRDIMIAREVEKGKIIYVRGTNSASFRGGRLLTQDNPDNWFIGGSLMRYALGQLNFSIRYEKTHASIPSPVNVISRHDNAFFFAGYVPNQTVEHKFLFPQGAPVFTGMETQLENGYSMYRLPKSWHEECRIFVKQEDGIISCFEMVPGYKIKRRIGIKGLKDATVRVYPGIQGINTSYRADRKSLINNVSEDEIGMYFEYLNVNGQMVVAW